MSFIPGLGIARGMAFTLKRFFEPKVTIRYPEVANDQSPKFRGRLQLLYDEYGTLKCETCFQCAQACPIECIDMGGVDSKNRYHVHWGPPETYGERREESALRRSGRTVPDADFRPFEPIDLTAIDEILARHEYDPSAMLEILGETQEAYGYLPVAALKQISGTTGAWYAMLYGTATYYRHLRFDRPVDAVQVCRCTSCLMAGAGRVIEALEEALGSEFGQVALPGHIRIEQLASHLSGAPAPLVAIDGRPQSVTAATAAAWAAALTGSTGGTGSAGASGSAPGPASGASGSTSATGSTDPGANPH
ncbi:MAG TPA: NAD(P)H-dependent oxidoreductase subunit E [Candidatus Saccharimonadales bacterium]|nr:NAD(P)H-dependent oxidoreductase subunit E [Candidatus Saccharimonadales bacterium]